MAKLTFINHAGYVIESEKSVLIVDPWVEGPAFDNGWALLDNSISNFDLVKFIIDKKKRIFIWISHEHPDHLSMSFLKELQKNQDNIITFLFQKTLDGRVAKFIRKLGFKVIESNDTAEVIDPHFSIVTFPYSGGDSFCLAMCEGVSILNINDCAVGDEQSANSIRHSYNRYTGKIDLLMTQFGYANWVGNPDEVALRENSAKEKLDRISIQCRIFDPRSVVPFASFVYFSDSDNFHANDAQNSPQDVANLFSHDSIKSNLIILKPWDELNLESDLDLHRADHDSNVAHWVRLSKVIKPEDLKIKQYSIEEIIREYRLYNKKIFKCFLVAPYILERIGFIGPLKIYLYDLKTNIQLSYCEEICVYKGFKSDCDISMASATLVFTIKNEYGANTTHVNGKFEKISNAGVYAFLRYFSLQEYMRMGFGVNNFFATLKIVTLKIIYIIKRSTLRLTSRLG